MAGIRHPNDRGKKNNDLNNGSTQKKKPINDGGAKICKLERKITSKWKVFMNDLIACLTFFTLF